MTPYGDTNVDLSSVRFRDIQLRGISQEITQPSVTKVSLKITHPKLHLNLPWANELNAICNSFTNELRPHYTMMTSSNGNIFRVTGHLCGKSPVTGEFPSQRPVTRSFDVFFDICLGNRLSKQSTGWWFETPSRSLWRHSTATWLWRLPLGLTNTA